MHFYGVFFEIGHSRTSDFILFDTQHLESTSTAKPKTECLEIRIIESYSCASQNFQIGLACTCSSQVGNILKYIFVKFVSIEALLRANAQLLKGRHVGQFCNQRSATALGHSHWLQGKIFQS